MSEFLLYCTKTNALRKGFLSIKGIYYQVEIKGILITWISPYQFSMDVPFDVDFKVLNTFLDFNTCLLGFVNFKLFQDLGLSLGNDSESNQVLDTNGVINIDRIFPRNCSTKSIILFLVI